MTERFIRVETERAVTRLILNRPPANALDLELVEEFHRVLDRLEKTGESRAVVILSEVERVFIAGADIKMMHAREGEELVRFMDNYDSRLQQVTSRVEALPQPTVAVINGHALGGGLELALACDMIVASETAVFGQPEINLGVIPGAGGTQRLARTVGKAIAMEMCLNDRRLSAAEAERFGLVNRVAPVESYLDEAIALAAQIAARAPLAVRLAKEAVNMALETPLSAGLAYERNLFYALFATADQKEGMAAFLEKRQPVWKGE